MNARIGLVERAAALLRDHGGERQRSPLPDDSRTEPGMRDLATAPRSSRVMAPQLSRNFALDRRHLARIGIIMPWTTTARVVEEFRIIKRNIRFPWQLADHTNAMADAGAPRVVMVTSSRPREGKTFCAINLALAFAAEENLVSVLIDADPIRSGASKLLRLPQEPGFTDVLAGQCQLEDALIQTDLTNLVFLPPGPHGPHIPEMLAGRELVGLLGAIAQRYPDHVIIMDTPPCLVSTDPSAIASIASQIVFIVESGHTQQSEIESSLSLLTGCERMSFLLNKVPTGSSEHFGSYSYSRPAETEHEAGED
jgi:protein-tyrosine kinase